MYSVKFFAQLIMSAPCTHRFKMRSNAVSYAKQVASVCKEKNLGYSVTIYKDGQIIFEEKED